MISDTKNSEIVYFSVKNLPGFTVKTIKKWYFVFNVMDAQVTKGGSASYCNALPKLVFCNVNNLGEHLIPVQNL